ncbi:MAG: hypothetical protein DMG22_12210 [Acidobacteria bacterium]|nr:MAG: hypothetical protein DMG22_12210 [Acidobacteriota bacterium]
MRKCRQAWLISIPTLLFGVRFGMAQQASKHQARIEKTEYRGWKAYKLTNGIISLFVAPEIGGRAIQLQLGDQEFFFVNKDLAGKVLPESQNNLKAGWANYGGDKVWPAPEGWMSDDEWPSIPYFILDGSRFESEVVKESPGEVAVRVTSPLDPRTGVQFVRTYHVFAGTTRVKVEQVMRNISRREIRWGIWHLIQNDGADASDPSKPNPELYMYVPINPRSQYPRGFYNPYGDARHPSYEVAEDGRMLRIHYLYRVGKVAADSTAGWFAVVNGQKNIGFVESFQSFPDQEYPDGASVESWNDGPGTISRGPWDQTLPDDPKRTPYFLESEVLSPYARLEPGEEYEFTVNWSPTSITNPIIAQTPSSAGAVSEPLSAEPEGRNVHLRGIFGTFVPGTLEAVFYSAMGEELKRENLQPVDPRGVVRLDKSVPLAAGAFRVSVRVLDADGENRGYLGNAVLK